MKKIAAFIALVTVFISVLPAPPREDLWKKVSEADKKGLPKTAIKHLKDIEKSTLQGKDHAEYVRAFTKRIALEANIEGNKPEERIFRLQKVLDEAPDEIQPVLETILANWYWQYFQRNQWRFMQRTQTAAPPSEGFQTWDLARILAETSKHFDKALESADILKKVPIEKYDALLSKPQGMPDSYRPTLFDFLAFEAIKFYQSGLHAKNKSQFAFEISVEDPVFDDMDTFLQWKPVTEDENAPLLRAIQIYQDLILFHQKDQQPDALLDVNLQRLLFGNNHAYGPEKSSRYKASLKTFHTKWADHKISARAIHHHAQALHTEGDYVAAHKLATRGKKAHPGSPGAKHCHNLIVQIEKPESRHHTERLWNNPAPEISVRYRNLDQVHFRIIPIDYMDRLKKGKWNHEYFYHDDRSWLLQQKPVMAWSEKLPPTKDYQSREETFPAPLDLKPGFYALVSSHKKNFTDKENNAIRATNFWVSDMALVTRNRRGSSTLEGFVLRGESGEPVSGAKVKAWRLDGKQVGFLEETTTNEDGLWSINPGRSNLILIAEKDGQIIPTANVHRASTRISIPKPYERTQFFTDRSLYRPGQIIQYKGIAYRVDQHKDDYRTLANRVITVVFSDRNGQEIEKREHRTNSFGSFSGSFAAPRDRLLGRMRIQTRNSPSGSAWVNVEEYKRPKFQVSLEPPEKAYKLGALAKISGKATAYTGAAVNDAKVKYRVVRNMRYPAWWGWRYWWRPPYQSQSQEIAHGTTRTSPDGSFEVEFTAKPDPTVDEGDEPTFTFSVYADVTDTTGETRSGNYSVQLGYTTLRANLNASKWPTTNEPVELNLSTTTLDGKPLVAEGTIRIQKLKEPKKIQRTRLRKPYYHWNRHIPEEQRAKPKPDLSSIQYWEPGEVVHEEGWTTAKDGTLKFVHKLPVGAFRATIETEDSDRRTVTALATFQVIDPTSDKFGIGIPHFFGSKLPSVEPGAQYTAIWGTGYDKGRAYIEVEHRGKILQQYWTNPAHTQFRIEQEVTEAMRGGFTVRVTYVRENRAYLESSRVQVPWSNKKLDVRWEHFTSKLEPGKKSNWTAVITGPDAKGAVAEMVAGLYDASLDAYKPHNWTTVLGQFRQESERVYSKFNNQTKTLENIAGSWQNRHERVNLSYRAFPREITATLWGYQWRGMRKEGDSLAYTAARNRATVYSSSAALSENMSLPAVASADFGSASFDAVNSLIETKGSIPTDRYYNGTNAEKGPDLSKVKARANLNETAFFFPHVVSSKEGEVRLEFTMPEALTEWKLLGFTHDAEMRSGSITATTVTSKDLMIQPNPPRFLREGDELEFTVKVSNQSDKKQQGTVRLAFSDARSGKSVDAQLGNLKTDLTFDIPTKQSKSFSWRIRVPDSLGPITYKAIGATKKLSDGEEGMVPVLSRRILVTESIPLPIRGPKTRKFNFSKLVDSDSSNTLEHKNLLLQVTSNPAWYAVMALPYLMEFPHECSEQTFNRFYANALAHNIAQSDPKIRRVFDQWKGTDTLDSPMEKNQDLKSLLIEETPWVRQAKNESQARRNVAILFDDNRLNSETRRLHRKLAQMQLADGAWPWFPGGRGNDYITLYITTGFGRMLNLGLDIDPKPAHKALTRLDRWIDSTYRDILKHSKKERNNLSSQIALYLYARSFFLEKKPVPAKSKEAVDYFLGQARKFWLQLPQRQSQAHLSLGLKRFGDIKTAKGILRSIKQRAVHDPEMGMFWRDLEESWWWYRAPIETQAMMIELFEEVGQDKKAVEDCKAWLLKQKQTQDWKTTKATADAVYALLLRGTDLLASDELVSAKLGDQNITPKDVEAGTGFYESRYAGAEIKSSLGKVTLKKMDEGVAWGSLHWQYLEDVSKITPHTDTPLTLVKKLFVKENTPKGPVLKAAGGPMEVGDELVVRLELRTDRDLEYVHLKDHRGSGTEPVNVLSRYKWQDGMGYYESTRDTASHFYIDFLRKGVYVFEYSVRVQHKGQYQTGMASIQCMYAPEFNSHSESIPINVR